MLESRDRLGAIDPGRRSPNSVRTCRRRSRGAHRGSDSVRTPRPGRRTPPANREPKVAERQRARRRSSLGDTPPSLASAMIVAASDRTGEPSLLRIGELSYRGGGTVLSRRRAARGVRAYFQGFSTLEPHIRDIIGRCGAPVIAGAEARFGRPVDPRRFLSAGPERVRRSGPASRLGCRTTLPRRRGSSSRSSGVLRATRRSAARRIGVRPVSPERRRGCRHESGFDRRCADRAADRGRAASRCAESDGRPPRPLRGRVGDWARRPGARTRKARSVSRSNRSRHVRSRAPPITRRRSGTVPSVGTSRTAARRVLRTARRRVREAT